MRARSVRRLSRGEFVAPPRDDSVPAPRPGGAGYRAAKRAFDIVFSLAVIAVPAVPVALLCLAIVLDSPGAPFFRQERVGLGGRRIYIWKLRSMVPDAHVPPVIMRVLPANEAIPIYSFTRSTNSPSSLLKKRSLAKLSI